MTTETEILHRSAVALAALDAAKRAARAAEGGAPDVPGV